MKKPIRIKKLKKTVQEIFGNQFPLIPWDLQNSPKKFQGGRKINEIIRIKKNIDEKDFPSKTFLIKKEKFEPLCCSRNHETLLFAQTSFW